MHGLRHIETEIVEDCRLVSTDCAWRCSRHSLLDASCLKDCRWSQASQTMLCLDVLEACMVGGTVSRGRSRFAGS